MNLFPLATIGGAALGGLGTAALLNKMGQPQVGQTMGSQSAQTTPQNMLPQGPQPTPPGTQTIMSPNALPGLQGQPSNGANLIQGNKTAGIPDSNAALAMSMLGYK